ncbi:uncharacterized protein EV420DRAFT_1282903 [Desarmillaria tabescens]|uniref:C2H2-type domain-containing protein n=1 Tax=Armillaria tabescens TaxID=1929756 RepID=A0AA39J341_ARMTA|nr:uncharacterized protein EV420DRAFT_1282903 [Desarmillaria tabescens]KAK0433929.1 hypothetical protein EV420DRAFT_1282903 [Desarmillaria tabescens]
MPRHRCPWIGCNRVFKRAGDLTRHVNSRHRSHPASINHISPISRDPSESEPDISDYPYRDDTILDDTELPTSHSQSPHSSVPTPASEKPCRTLHPFLTGVKTDRDGHPLPPDTPPPADPPIANVWAPFNGEVQFHLADFLFRKVEMSQSDINELLDLWSLDMHRHGDDAPFDNHQALYKAIDEIRVGSAPWKCFETVVPDTLGRDAPEWQRRSYQIWFRDPDTVISNILANRDFEKEFDTTPYVDLDATGQRRWSDFMSGNYAWCHVAQIFEADSSTEGAMYVSVILGSDKTTVSVATGNVEYYPVYLSIGNLHNSARRGHCNGVVPIAFLAIPKSDRKYDRDVAFRLFKKKLYHESLTAILSSLIPAMTMPVVRQCPDGHYRRVIYDLGPYIADYPEQVLLAGIVQGWCVKCTSPAANLDDPGERRSRKLTEVLLEAFADDGDVLWDNYGIDEDILPFTFNFPRADIHEMISSDLLHQIIKGSFKDHLVEWVHEYLVLKEGETHANEIMDDIDRRRFPQGQRFKQWTGDDSKALMKVYLAAVAEYLPEAIMKTLSAFMDFCYLVRCSDFDESTLNQVKETIRRFHHFREAFKLSGVRESFSLPRQHAIIHYPSHIMEFGAPNGLCSSITESRHITAVKKPWRRSNRYNALSQMLLTNQCLDKLVALQTDLIQHGLVEPLQAPPADPFDNGIEDEGAMDGERTIGEVTLAKTPERAYPRDIADLGQYIGYPDLPALTQLFLHEQLTQRRPDNFNHISDTSYPIINSPVHVFHSATATFYSPSNISGIWGMRRERICATPSWHGYPRYDCALAIVDEEKSGFRGMNAVRILLFFSFRHNGKEFPCALVHWFNTYGRLPDAKTGLWIVRPDFRGTARHTPVLSVIHVDTLLQGTHLLPVFGS